MDMTRLRPLPPRKVIKALVKLGFKPVRMRGSHLVLKREDGRLTVVPVHPGEEIGRGLLRKIIRDAGVSVEEFMEVAEDRLARSPARRVKARDVASGSKRREQLA